MTKSLEEMSKLLEGRPHVQCLSGPLLEIAHWAATHSASITLEEGGWPFP